MISLRSFYPQGEAVVSLERQLQNERMTHALLICGEPGIGKWTLSQAIAAYLLCEDGGSGRPCGKCRSCIQLEQLEHPDLIILEKDRPLTVSESKTVIPVSDIEEMIRRINRKGFQSDRHVVIIRHAEDMKAEAQNKLLKTLENPPDQTYFLLTCIKTDLILSTVLSRCRVLNLHPWGKEAVLRILEEHGITGSLAEKSAAASGGSPGRALQIAGDDSYWLFRREVCEDFFDVSSRSRILSVSNKWKDRKGETEMLFSVLENILHDMMHRSFQQDSLSLADDNIPDRWRDFTQRAGAEEYSRLFDSIQLARKRIAANVNFQAVIEQLLLIFMEAVV